MKKKKKKRKQSIKWASELEAEITSCGDTNMYGMIVWLKTKNEKLAEKRTAQLIKRLNGKMK